MFLVVASCVSYYLRRRTLCFHFGLFVCPSDNWKSCEPILTKFLGRVGHAQGTNEFNFGDDLDHRPDPGVWSPKSAFTGLSKKYQQILMKFYGELGCGLETWLHFDWLQTDQQVAWLHFGDDPHHYPDPEFRSGSGKNCHVVNTHRTDALQKSFSKSTVLAVSAGLCSLSISSWYSICIRPNNRINYLSGRTLKCTIWCSPNNI